MSIVSFPKQIRRSSKSFFRNKLQYRLVLDEAGPHATEGEHASTAESAEVTVTIEITEKSVLAEGTSQGEGVSAENISAPVDNAGVAVTEPPADNKPEQPPNEAPPSAADPAPAVVESKFYETLFAWVIIGAYLMNNSFICCIAAA